MRRAWVVLLLIAGALAARPAVAGLVADEVRRLEADAARVVRVDGFRLRAGLATVLLSDGVLVPSTAVAGRPVEFAFIGRGRVELEAPDEVEAGQLELFAGSGHLVEGFERAVFVVALDDAADALTARSAAGDDSRVGEAAALYDDWRSSSERKRLDVEARLFADGLGDSLAAGFFCGVFDGRRLGRFLYVVDPLADEQITLGQFVRPELSRREERRVRRDLEAAQRRGKLIGIDVADLGEWNTWVSASLEGPDGRPTPGTPGVEPTDYRLDVALDGRDLVLEGSARISLRVLLGDLRTVAFGMSSELEAVRVADARGRELEWYRGHGELVAVLAEPAAAGERLEIVVDYRGRPIDKVASGAFVQRDTTGWYPHAGTIDRATYTLTVRWPDDLDVVAPGRLEDAGLSGGVRWRRWRLDRPAIGISFEVGRYDRALGRAGDVSVDVAVDRVGQRADRELARDILATVVDAVEFFEEVYGAYPLERLQVVSSPRGFSQGLLGFVSLSTAAVIDWQEWGELLGVEDRRTVIAHEVAHQWWGNLVGWRSYRDQWISEAMANYSALLWSRNRVGRTGDDRLGLGPTSGWQAELGRTTDDGRPIESLGPLVIGARLDSSISSLAYPAIVYKKGAVVLDMLSNYFREETFLEILRNLVELAAHRVISTDSFLAAIAHLGDTDLGWFSRQYVYGTGLPEITYTYETHKLEDGRWAVSGTASQAAPYRYRYAVVETAEGVADVRRAAESHLDVADSVLVVPFQVGIDDRPATADGRRSLLRGRLVISGAVSPFRLEFDREPAVFWLDRDGEVFGRFFAADRWPKRTLFYRGQDLAAAGDPDGARDAFRRALQSVVAVIPPGWEDSFRYVDVLFEGESLDARIRLALARLALDAGDLDTAKSELDRATDLIKSRDRWLLGVDRLVVESRVDLLSNGPQPALKRLKKRVLAGRRFDSPETWALLAVAAEAVGDVEVFEQAAGRARELGVELGPLDPLVQPSPAP